MRRRQVSLRIWPSTAKAAAAFVREHHRHLPDVGGGRFAAALIDEQRQVRGVAVAGNGPQEWERLHIARVAVEDGLPGPTGHANCGCAQLYGAICRAGKALGYLEAWTYTLLEEPGTSLRAAGFVDMGLTEGGEHDRICRRRRPAKRPEPKRRWRRILSGQGAP